MTHSKLTGSPPKAARLPTPDVKQEWLAAPASPHARTATEIFRRIIHGGWRRRLLIIVPVMLMVPISIAAAIFLPRTYVTRTLLLLQESGRENPLAKERSSANKPSDRMAELDALMKSDRVLRKVMNSTVYAQSDDNIKEAQIADLRKSLSLDLIGNDLLEIRLRGTRAAGLGAQLQAVTTQLVDALVNDPGATTVGKLLIEDRRKKLEQATARRDALESASGVPAPSETEGGSVNASGEAPPGPQTYDAQSPKGISDSATAAQQLEAANRDVMLAEKSYREYAERFGNPIIANGIGLVPAAERIRVIDAPKDPRSATISPLIFLISGIAGGLCLGSVLAWAAEMLDPTIRELDELAAAAGVPALARLPRKPTFQDHIAKEKAFWGSPWRWTILLGGSVALIAIARWPNIATHLTDQLNAIFRSWSR